MTRPIRLILALAAPLLLASCILSPTKFTSTLDIGANRSFTFTYVGNVEDVEDKQAGKDTQPSGDSSASDEAELKALANTLSKEYGYRSVKYAGGRTLAIDYRISGTLDHAFVFPFNPDGQVLVPFLAIELRGKDRVRVKAPGYAPAGSTDGSGLGGGNNAKLDGTFTLTTNASVVSQNQEDGAQTLPDGRKQIVWHATPQTKDAPMAVLKVAPLP